MSAEWEWARSSSADIIVIEAWYHSDAGDNVIFNLGGLATPPSGVSDPPAVVANVSGDSSYCCTRMVMSIDGIEVAQDFVDHGGNYCASNFTAYQTITAPSAPIPSLDSVGLLALVLLIVTMAIWRVRRSATISG